MTATAWPVAAKMKPRECISTWMVGPKHFKQLAALRVAHPGGVPIMEPDSWSGAFDGDRLVAAIGWKIFEPGVITVIELDKTTDRWGTIGTGVLIHSFIASAEAQKMRVQALILPSNKPLKAFLENLGAKVVLEIYEKVET
jgi:hypothetical protein